MSLSKSERLLAESFKSMLASDDALGLSQHKAAQERAGEVERGFEHLHGQIDEMFMVKTTDLTHHTGICSAFSKVHSYKYIDDPSFARAMIKEMTAQGIPEQERVKAIDYIDTIIEELKNEQTIESSFGFHPELDKVMELPGEQP